MDREIDRDRDVTVDREVVQTGTTNRAGAGADIAAGSSFIEALAGIAAIVLGILGLVGVVSMILAEVATIVVGGALVIQGAAVMSGASELMSEYGEEGAATYGFGGMSVEFVGGVATIVLGILALVAVHSRPLMSVAVIVVGGTLMLSAGTISSLAGARTPNEGNNSAGSMFARQMAASSSSTQVLLGIAIGILGILAVLGHSHQMSLILVAWIVAGAATLMSGSALGARVTSMFH